MYLTAYHFDGDPSTLAAAHDKLTEHFPQDAQDVHLCVATGEGIVVYDGCPTREVAESFHGSPEFVAAVAGVGLPSPRIEPIGEIVWSTAGVS